MNARALPFCRRKEATPDVTGDEAIRHLRNYLAHEIRMPKARTFGRTQSYAFNKAVYERCLVKELIDRIRESDEDPIAIVRHIYRLMDDTLCESESGKVWAFASTMGNCAARILGYLTQKERMMNRNEGNRL